MAVVPALLGHAPSVSRLFDVTKGGHGQRQTLPMMQVKLR